jgi:plasmid segregation protein ParM
MATPTVQNNRITIGLDIGYGVVKAFTPTQSIVFPSVCGHARQMTFQAEDITAHYPGDQIKDDDGNWFVGNLALNQLPPAELLRLRGRTANEAGIGNVFRRRLAKVVIGKLLSGITDGGVVHIRIATGLPVAHMTDSQELKEALLGQHLIKTDSAHLIANVTEVMVMPQPYGCIYAHVLTPEGEINRYHSYKRTGVVDVGTYTVDIALDDEGEYVDAESGSVEGGVYVAHERIADILEQRYRQKMPYKSVEGVLRTGEFRARGQLIDMREEVEEALQPLRSATLNLMNDKWKSGANVDVIFLAGGGAALVQEGVFEAYEHVQLVRDAQLANARGYLHYAQFKEKV